ncbi:hypothetical protein QBC32DRAFT_385445 [Pseudoneurospora amorphoporcata]|uniref:Uncharacterized protein n=1 Tax=Pseudoneurospora amorphoporcata TaxID=241081 RepID=A0AAN6P1U7_9PEZI|nr:hypothetical protein QBC32DRAFT_385445 [Pseudoneurospora amorphoporcata]
MLGKKRGWEIDQVPLCKACLVEVEVEGKERLGGDEDGEKKDLEKVMVMKGLERIDRVDGGLTRRRWEMREGEKEREKEKTGGGGKDGLLSLRRGAVDDRSLASDQMASSSDSVKPETIYVNISDPVGREAFRPSPMKSIPEWMQSGAREHLERRTGSALAVNSSHDKPREQTTDHTSTISTPRSVSEGLSDTSSTATVIQTPPQPTASHAASTRRRSSAISPRATSPAPSIDAISRPSSMLGRRTPNLRTGTSFVSEQSLIVPSMSSNHTKETAKVSAKDLTRDSWLSTDSNVSSRPPTVTQPESSSRPSSVRSVATIFERGIASKDQRHTLVNQPLPLLRVLQQPYRPLTPIRSDTSLSSSSPHLQQSNLATGAQRAQTHELGAANLPKPIQILRRGQAGQSSMNRATVPIPVVSTSSEYLDRYQPVKASTSNSSSFLSSFSSSSPAAQGMEARSAVHARSSIRAGGHGLGPGVSTITRGWEGQLQLSNNTSPSTTGETERDLKERFQGYSSSQPPASLSVLQSSYSGAEGQRTSIRRSVSHSIRREGAHDEGVGTSLSSQPEPYLNAHGQMTIRRSISHSVRREGAHDQGRGQSHHFISPQSPTLPSRALPFRTEPNNPPNGPNNPSGLTAPMPRNFTVHGRFVKRPSIKGGPTLGSVVTSVSTTEGHTPSTPSLSTWAGPPSSSESSPGTQGTGSETGTGEEKGGGVGSSFRPAWTRTRKASTGNNTMSGTSAPVMMSMGATTAGGGGGGGGGPVKTLSKRRSVHVELKRLFGRQ